jgi:hypothetical protein
MSKTIRRSGEAVAAQMRRAGTMKHRNVPRGGARNEMADFLQEADENLEEIPFWEQPDAGDI